VRTTQDNQADHVTTEDGLDLSVVSRRLVVCVESNGAIQPDRLRCLKQASILQGQHFREFASDQQSPGDTEFVPLSSVLFE
jgi:hypothetical protein